MDARRSTRTEDHTSTHLNLNPSQETRHKSWVSCQVVRLRSPQRFHRAARQACSNATLPSGDHDDVMFRGSSNSLPHNVTKCWRKHTRDCLIADVSTLSGIVAWTKEKKIPRPLSIILNYIQLCNITRRYLRNLVQEGPSPHKLGPGNCPASRTTL